MASAATAAALRRKLRENLQHIDEARRNKLVKTLIVNNIFSVEHLFRHSDTNFVGLKEVSEEDRAILRDMCNQKKRDAGSDDSVQISPHKRMRVFSDHASASAESVLQCINLASTMRVERPNERPGKMIDRLKAQNQSGGSRKLFLEISRLEAICGSRISIKETATALRCWTRFGSAMGLFEPGCELPPSVIGLLAWSRIFACKGTFANYLSNLSFACELAGVCRNSFDDPSLKRAKKTIGTLQAPPKPKRGIRLPLVERLEAWNRIRFQFYCTCCPTAFFSESPRNVCPSSSQARQICTFL